MRHGACRRARRAPTHHRQSTLRPHVQFGIFDHMEQRGSTLRQLYEERLQMLEFADDGGFVRYHKAEHHFTPLDCAPSATVFLAAASQRTRRIRLGSLVQLLPFYHPLRLIEEICTLDHLCGGRLDVGVGKGISPIEHALWGLEPEEARARADETLAILRAGLVTDRLTYRGAFQTSSMCRCTWRRCSGRIRRCGIRATSRSRASIASIRLLAVRWPRWPPRCSAIGNC